MLQLTKSRWVGNKWASIEIHPVDAVYFLPILHYLQTQYMFSHSKIVDAIDGYMTDFKIDGCEVYMHIDTWSFSLAFEYDHMRDNVLADLSQLPNDYF